MSSYVYTNGHPPPPYLPNAVSHEKKNEILEAKALIFRWEKCEQEKVSYQPIGLERHRSRRIELCDPAQPPPSPQVLGAKGVTNHPFYVRRRIAS